MSPRVRLALRIVGYVVLALVTFVFALHLTFPYERVRDQALDALASKYDVNIGGVERSWVPGRFSLTAVTLRSRPSVVGQPTTTMYFKRVEIDLGFRALLSGKTEIGLEIATGNGKISGSIVAGKREIDINFKLNRVPLSMIPGISDAVGLPMSGNADGRVKMSLLKAPGKKGDVDWSKANGVFELTCAANCSIGDGVAKVYPKAKRPGDEAMVKDGVPVPALRITSFKLALDIVKGQAKRRTFDIKSADGDADLDIDIKLARNINDSQVTGCIKYKCSKELYDREPLFRSTCDFGSPAVDDKGMHHIKLTGKLSNVRRLGLVCDGPSKPDPDPAGMSPDRPRIDMPAPEPQPLTPPPPQAIDAGVWTIDIPPPPPPTKLMTDDVPKGEPPPDVTPPPIVPPPDQKQGESKDNAEIKPNGGVTAPEIR